jgi:hypothetical protein
VPIVVLILFASFMERFGRRSLADNKEGLTSWKKTCQVRLKSEWKHLTRNETQFLFLCNPSSVRQRKNFQLSQKRPSKVDLPKPIFKELDEML